MSKLIAATIATGGAATVTVGGSYLLQKGSEVVDSAKKSKSDPSEGSSKLAFETINKFKQGKGGKCAKDLFDQTPEIDFNSVTGNPTSTPTGDSFFGTSPTDEGTNTKGCLIIDWEKKTSSDQANNWSGTFTWTGAFVNGGKGFITFNVAKTSVSGSDKQLNLTGGFYLLEKGSGTTDKGTIKGWKEIKEGDNKKITTTDVDKFPKAKGGTEVQESGKDYWGFTDGSNLSLDKIANDVTADPISDNKKWSWTWNKDSGNNKVSEWDGNELKGGDHMYDKNTTVDLKTKLDGFSKGTWTKVENPSK